MEKLCFFKDNGNENNKQLRWKFKLNVQGNLPLHVLQSPPLGSNLKLFPQLSVGIEILVIYGYLFGVHDKVKCTKNAYTGEGLRNRKFANLSYRKVT